MILSQQVPEHKPPHLVVVGNGMAGMKTVEYLLQYAPNQYRISVIGKEPYTNYNRIMLSQILSGEKSLAEIMIHDENWYQQQAISLYKGETVISIDRENKQLCTENNTLDYNFLLLATGSNPFMLAIPGHQLEGVIPFRDIAQVNTLLHYSQLHQRAVVLGGGLLGLEAAYGLVQQGMDVTVLHSRDYILNRQLDKNAAQLLQQSLAAKGVKFVLSAETIAITGKTRVDGVQLQSGQWLGCELFVMAIGVRPNIKLAQQAGLDCNLGIQVNDFLQTTDPAIYAVGECIEHAQQTFGLVAPLYYQAEVCAKKLAGYPVAAYQTKPTATQLKVSGIQLFSVGDFDATGAEVLSFTDQGVYKKLVIKDNLLIGAVLYGETQDGRWFQQLIESKTPVDQVRHSLIFGQAYHADLIAPSLTAEIQ